jgi:tetratricopeptide (TPR) repeat protein
LLRSVHYGAASMHERAAAHGALAAVLARSPGEAAADGRAWHLAVATLPPDEEVSGLLAAAGTRARRRGGNLEAARAFEQAARFGTASTRAALLLRAARCWQLAGRTSKVLPLLDEALTLSDDQRLRALIRHMGGYVRMWRALPRDGLAEMVNGAQDVEDLDPGRAAMMYADAALAYFMLGQPVKLLGTTKRAFELSERAEDNGVSRLVSTVAYAGALVINGHRAQGRELLESVRAQLIEVDPLARTQELAHAAYIWMWLEDYEIADRLLNRIIDQARRNGALGVLPQALAMASELAYRMGRWPQARACAEESVALAIETRQANMYGLHFVARIDAVQGRADEAQRMIKRLMTTAGKYEAVGMDPYSGHTLGLLALGAGDLDEAIRRLEAVRTMPMAVHTRDQTIIPWAFDLVEAYARAGRTAEAEELLEQIAVPDKPRADGEPVDLKVDWLTAMTWRCRGLLASRAEMPAAFARALAAHDRCEMPFERARTLLCLGERMRRSRQRGPARQHLRRALEIFEQLGASAWATRARNELAATGEAATRGTGVVSMLTPQELQVALVVGRGATNQEAAAALFLSQKTIEYHLSNIYRKTNLRARSELSVFTEAAS